MANCDMCGKEGYLVLAEVEGTELKVCRDCAAYGKIIKQERKPKKFGTRQKKQVPEKEIIESVVDNYSKIIRDKREKLGLKQEEMAKKLAERVSLLQKIETGNIVPSFALAKKLENILGITLIEKKEIVPMKLKAKSGKLTIGDMIKLK